MRLSLFLNVLILTCVIALPNKAMSVTIVDSVTWENSTYHLLSRGTWQDSESLAIALGGNLATINSQQEQDFLWGMWGLSGSSFHNFGEIWIGLTDEISEGHWAWSSGAPLNFSNWAPGEPNSLGVENYAHMWHSTAGTWNDASGSNEFAGIVEINTVDAPSASLFIILVTLLLAARKQPRYYPNLPS